LFIGCDNYSKLRTFGVNFNDKIMKRFSIVLFILAFSVTFFAQNKVYHLLVGTYTNTGKSEGIYSYDLNMKTAEFIQKSVVKGVSNPSYLAITPDKSLCIR
jgi:6-phosphogluconolactonase